MSEKRRKFDREFLEGRFGLLWRCHGFARHTWSSDDICAWLAAHTTLSVLTVGAPLPVGAPPTFVDSPDHARARHRGDAARMGQVGRQKS